MVQDADVGKAIKVRVSFTDDEGNAESVTSDGVPVTTLPLTATTHDVTVFHDGATAFTFELRFSEAPGGGFSATTLRDQALTVSGGSIDSVRQLETGKNLRWEITVQPSGNEDVIVSLLPTIDCADQGAICTGDGRTLSVALATFVLGPQNSAATGPDRRNIGLHPSHGASGKVTVSFTARRRAGRDPDDADIGGATTSSYTLVAGDVGKAIKVNGQRGVGDQRGDGGGPAAASGPRRRDRVSGMPDGSTVGGRSPSRPTHPSPTSGWPTTLRSAGPRPPPTRSRTPTRARSLR